MAQGTTVKVAGPLIVAENMADARMYDVVRVSRDRLVGEIIAVSYTHLGNVVDTADNAVGTFHQRIADDGGQHDAMGTGVQGHNDDTIGIPQVMGFAGPLVHAQQQVMMLSVNGRGQLLIGNGFNGLRVIRQGGAAAQGQDQGQDKADDSLDHIARSPFLHV